MPGAAGAQRDEEETVATGRHVGADRGSRWRSQPAGTASARQVHQFLDQPPPKRIQFLRGSLVGSMLSAASAMRSTTTAAVSALTRNWTKAGLVCNVSTASPAVAMLRSTI